MSAQHSASSSDGHQGSSDAEADLSPSYDLLSKKCASLQHKLADAVDAEKRAQSKIHKLQLMSKSQAAILRTNLGKRIEERDALVESILEHVNASDPEAVARYTAELEKLQQEPLVRATQAHGAPSVQQLQAEVEELRRRNQELEHTPRHRRQPSADSEYLTHKVQELEQERKKLISLLHEVRERLHDHGRGSEDGGSADKLRHPPPPATGDHGQDKAGLEAEVLRLRAELERAQSAAASDSHSDLQTAHQEIGALKEQVKKVKAEKKAARKEAEEVVRMLKAEQKAKETKLVDDMETEVEKLLAEERAKLSRSSEELSTKLRAAQDANAKLEAEVRTLEAERKHSAARSRSVAALRPKVQLLRSANAELHRAVCDGFGSLPKLFDMTSKAITSEVLKRQALIQGNYRREYLERRRLFNLVQELRGNIRVFCRCRPPSKKELAREESGSVCVRFPEEGSVQVENEKGKEKVWEFDKVFSFDTPQNNVYREVSPLVTSVLDGYNVCIFAYGQTGSGKTYTMTGPDDNRGVNTRALEELFGQSHKREAEISDSISVSILEIYCEQIRDLLAEEVGVERLEVRQGERGNYVPNLTTVPVSEIGQVLELLALADRNRSTAATNMNEHSSRSHLMLSITIKSVNRITGQMSYGKLHLVDLAGSERISKSGATGQALKEAQAINKSLSALGDVIMSRAQKSAHVPYRNSTLTHLLQDSLSGDSKTLMFVCISPVLYNAEETFCSLNFAARVRTVELGKATKHVVTTTSADGRRRSMKGRPM